jgi:hypothetical protein
LAHGDDAVVTYAARAAVGFAVRFEVPAQSSAATSTTCPPTSPGGGSRFPTSARIGRRSTGRPLCVSRRANGATPGPAPEAGTAAMSLYNRTTQGSRAGIERDGWIQGMWVFSIDVPDEMIAPYKAPT